MFSKLKTKENPPFTTGRLFYPFSVEDCTIKIKIV